MFPDTKIEKKMDNRLDDMMKQMDEAALTNNGTPQDALFFDQLVRKSAGAEFAVTTQIEASHNIAGKVIDSIS